MCACVFGIQEASEKSFYLKTTNNHHKGRKKLGNRFLTIDLTAQVNFTHVGVKT